MSQQSPKLQIYNNFLSWARYSATPSLSCCTLLKNLNHSSILIVFFLKCILIVVIIWSSDKSFSSVRINVFSFTKRSGLIGVSLSKPHINIKFMWFVCRSVGTFMTQKYTGVILVYLYLQLLIATFKAGLVHCFVHQCSTNM